MKLQAEQAELANAVRWIARHIPNKSTQPTDLSVLLTAEGDHLTVAYSSGEVTASAVVDAHIIDPGKASVSGKVLADILGALPQVQVEISGGEEGVEIAAASNDFHLQSLDVHSYPALPLMPALSGRVAADVFAAAIAHVAPAMDASGALPEMTGIRLQPRGEQLQVMATDRYRVAVEYIPWEQTGDAVEALLPGQALVDIAKTAGTVDAVDLALTAGMAGVQVGNRSSVSRVLPVGKFSRVDTAFPKEFTATVTCDADEFREAVRRISLLLEGPQAIELAIRADDMLIQAPRGVEATGTSRIGCHLDGSSTFDVAFNPRRLLDGLASIEGEVALDLTTYSRPALLHAAVEDPTFQYLIIPHRDPAAAVNQ